MYDMDAQLTAAQAARLLGFPVHRIMRWRSLGHLEPVTPRHYRLGDILDVEQAMRRSPRSHRQ